MKAPAGQRPALVLFDLDHTLLDGDSDVLWCQFLIERGVLDPARFAERSVAMEAAYRAGQVDAAEFCNFYVSTLAGRSPAEWDALRRPFLAEVISPRIGPAARALVREALASAEVVVLTTATSRPLTELTAGMLGIEHLLATECEVDEAGRCTGRTAGVLNMREGKVRRLDAWLAARGQRLADFASRAYSDSINDLPLLEAADEAVVVHPDARLAAIAAARGWPSIRLHGAVA